MILNVIPAGRLYQPSLKFLDALVPLPNLPNNLSASGLIAGEQRV
jgi:hypothetical protein